MLVTHTWDFPALYAVVIFGHYLRNKGNRAYRLQKLSNVYTYLSINYYKIISIIVTGALSH